MAGWMTEHWHARRIKGPGPCETCGAAKSEVHHVNRDWHDNRLENLKRLCRSCHNLAHDRAKRCVICGVRQKGLGYCEKHYQRFKRWGNPLAYKINQNTDLRYEDLPPVNANVS